MHPFWKKYPINLFLKEIKLLNCGVYFLKILDFFRQLEKKKHFMSK